MAFLTYDEEHHRIAIRAVPGCGDMVRASAGLDHIAFTFDSLNDLAAAYLQRKARGILPVWSVNHGPTTSMLDFPQNSTMMDSCINFLLDITKIPTET